MSKESREKMLIGMNEIVLSISDEDAGLNSWLSLGVPDDADEDEIREMANDPDTFKYCCSLFLNIMSRKTTQESGLLVSRTETVDKDWYLDN